MSTTKKRSTIASNTRSENQSYYKRISFTVYPSNTANSVCTSKEDAIDKLKNWKAISYCIVGEESCPSTGRYHLQCYAEFKNDVRYETILNKFNKLNHPHFENSKGTPLENFIYCSKDKKHEEWGTRLPDDYKGKGDRGDLRGIAAEISEGLSVDQICIENPEMFHQYGRTLERLEDIALRKKWRQHMTTCDWIYGPTGVGKSHHWKVNYHPYTHYIWKLNDKGWQDGYTGQDIVVIDEFRGQIPYAELLLLLNDIPHFLPRRGKAPVPFLSKHVIITSSLHPKNVYEGVLERDDNIDQLFRRINLIHKTCREIVG